ncbi:hypothetical protein EL26_11315 [Tumebacillus flagellatus]|uniref:Uncharacterized protein n=1 Tax=Tumebacillus flagellatus TaxID=1157490 RepID=A0A074LME2_9BACL|nr:hypothetical protein EL26_11315 [Tumebacillus flagellatus]
MSAICLNPRRANNYEIFASIRSLSATIAINSELVGFDLPTFTVLPNSARIESTLPRLGVEGFLGFGNFLLLILLPDIYRFPI